MSSTPELSVADMCSNIMQQYPNPINDLKEMIFVLAAVAGYLQPNTIARGPDNWKALLDEVKSLDAENKQGGWETLGDRFRHVKKTMEVEVDAEEAREAIAKEKRTQFLLRKEELAKEQKAWEKKQALEKKSKRAWEKKQVLEKKSKRQRTVVPRIELHMHML